MEKQAEATKPAPGENFGGAVDYAPPPAYQGGAPAIVYQPQGVVSGDRPDDHLIMSVLTIFCCFWPLGVIALIKSIETRGHSDRGDLESARSSSKQALLFNRLSILVGVITWVVVFIIQLAWIIPVAVVAATATPYNDNINN